MLYFGFIGAKNKLARIGDAGYKTHTPALRIPFR
jgi:hypothetical protein